LPVSSHSDVDLPGGGGARSELRFAVVGPADADTLAELFARNSGAAIADRFDPFPLTAEQGRRIALDPSKDDFYLALAGDRALGFSMLRGFEAGYAIPSFGIFVDHEHQGHGVGRRLTEWTVEQARRRGCPSVRLSVYAANAPAVALYTSLGFREREREPVERRGRVDEKIVMLLELEA
jgi:ribosomal protein S18 acetylase RimI-like enzyme